MWLVDGNWLTSRLADPLVRVVDVRFAPAGLTARERFLAGHVPGAQHCDLERDLSDLSKKGRHPWPSTEHFARTLSKLGIGQSTHVVVCDDGTGAIAARLWFMLRAHGFPRVSLLDGGFARWKADGHPVETGEGQPVAPAEPMKLTLDSSRVVTRDEIEALVQQRNTANSSAPLLLDARAPDRYRGENETIDPKAGHIPGAQSFPFMGNVKSAEDPRFRTPDELRARFLTLGATQRPLIFYCGSGVTACQNAFAHAMAGFADGRVYIGSWSEWISEPQAPIATGSEPG
ncbi:MAG: sulfurtransferase [Deltaproteobacteria bacterium]|nr:sulfurtransferase [Deltaproteobacteria bacterium]